MAAVHTRGDRDDDWRRFFRAQGHPVAEPLGQGMDGIVYRLGNGLVGKAWWNRSADGIRPLGRFYDELAAQELPFATPRIIDVLDRDGRAVSVEPELPGTPLGDALDGGRLSVAAARDAFVEVVAALRTTRAGDAAYALPVFGEDTALSCTATSAPRTSWSTPPAGSRVCSTGGS